MDEEARICVNVNTCLIYLPPKPVHRSISTKVLGLSANVSPRIRNSSFIHAVSNRGIEVPQIHPSHPPSQTPKRSSNDHIPSSPTPPSPPSPTPTKKRNPPPFPSLSAPFLPAQAPPNLHPTPPRRSTSQTPVLAPLEVMGRG